MTPAERNPGEQLLLLAENHPGEVLCEAKTRSGALVRVEPEKLAVETVPPQSSPRSIVIRAHGVEAEFPSGTDIGIIAAFLKALSHA